MKLCNDDDCNIQGAAGVGKAVADWITKGRSPGNYLQFELARFTSLHNNPRFLQKRTEEVVGRHYKLKYPFGSYENNVFKTKDK